MRVGQAILVVVYLDALLGIALREPLSPHLQRLGNPTSRRVSPPSPDGSCFAHYEWQRACPPIALLTWITADGERVWGIRVLGAGPADGALGFAVGASRAAALACLPTLRAVGSGGAKLGTPDGSLVVLFAGDHVTEIRLQAPMA